MGFGEIVLFLFIMVMIFRTSWLIVDTQDPVLAAVRRGLSIAGFGLFTTVLFGLGFAAGEELAGPGGLSMSDQVGVFVVVSLACLGVAALRVAKERVPLGVLRYAPLLFLLAGLATGAVATIALGRTALVSGLR